jgi:hypothetical protein
MPPWEGAFARRSPRRWEHLWLSPPIRLGTPPHENLHAALTLFDPGSATRRAEGQQISKLWLIPLAMCADDAQSRFLEPSTFNQKPHAAAPAACRSSPPSAAPRRASADLVAERCDAAICPESGEKAEVRGLRLKRPGCSLARQMVTVMLMVYLNGRSCGAACLSRNLLPSRGAAQRIRPRPLLKGSIHVA